ncbi:MAG: hypothetical protein A2Y62_18110 [Candidatus Fischerbacteria bacterium RBG_13_37_8]|uniref:HTH arsR-type domain-containing protein n=1 Tax=Candidatus Fischerbacteria bacterium RBG_13_37_8 TaxID=1817863 RepID=A0A1F5VVH9_9BACT|nr:MAG: hypothetical protein A2Y62_18110 [Candidatus Fischerbacteria bacterium RBG_13_37_8]
MNKTRCIKCSELLKVIAHPIRLQLLCLMMNEQKNVSSLCKKLKLHQAVISHHLSLLRNKNIVKAQRKGTMVHYKLVDPTISAIMNALYRQAGL